MIINFFMIEKLKVVTFRRVNYLLNYAIRRHCCRRCCHRYILHRRRTWLHRRLNCFLTKSLKTLKEQNKNGFLSWKERNMYSLSSSLT